MDTKCVLCHVYPVEHDNQLCGDCWNSRTIQANDNVDNWGTNIKPGDAIIVKIDGTWYKAHSRGWGTSEDKRYVKTDIMQSMGFYNAPFANVRIIATVRDIHGVAENAALRKQVARLRAFVEEVANYPTYMLGRDQWVRLQRQAADLLASIDSASE